MRRTFQEWEKLYQKKIGHPIRSKAFAQCLIDLDKGFVYFTFNKDGDLIVCETAGDGKYWEKKILAIAKTHNCKRIYTTIYVRPEVYSRRYPEMKVFQRVSEQLTIMYREV